MALDILSGILVNESPVLYSFTSAHKEELNKDEPISDPIKWESVVKRLFSMTVSSLRKWILIIVLQFLNLFLTDDNC